MTEDGLRVIPLGGLGEFGMNTMVYEYGDDIIVVDAGMMFPEHDMPGIDFVVPDLTYLIERKDLLRGVILTHGHEDHIGGLSYLLREMNVPVYGTKLTLALASNRLREFRLLDDASLNEMSPGERLDLGSFQVESIPVTHSIADAVSLAIHTPVGTVVHTSDFKFDHTPVDRKPCDFRRLAELGDEGVLLLLSDSTNVDRTGNTPSERSIFNSLDRIFREAEQRLFLSTFSSNIHRLQQFIELAVKHERRLAVTGRSMVNNIRVASELEYMWVPNDLLISAKEVINYPPEEVAVLTTGSQGEPRSAMWLMALDDHAHMHIEEGDTVVLSARVIPGNEQRVGHMINHLMKRGAEVIYEYTDNVHVSGHGSQEDLKLMLTLTQPRFFIPLHGEYRNLMQHAHLAESMGVPRNHIVVVEDGDCVELTPENCEIVDQVPSGRIMVDGKLMDELEDIVLRDRQQLAQDGMVIPIIVMDSQNGQLVAGPDIISRGFVYMDESEELMDEAKEVIRDVLGAMNQEELSEIENVQEEIRANLRRFFRRLTDRHPIILPMVMRA